MKAPAEVSRMHKPVVPAVVVLLLLCAVLCSCQAEVKAVRLCGKDFVRAVVYTCGGSRWRRAFTGDTDADVGALSAETLGGWGLRTELRRRDVNSILVSVCCTMGCRKSDLSLLC